MYHCHKLLHLTLNPTYLRTVFYMFRKAVVCFNDAVSTVGVI
jgi:hypothetical protein